MCACRHVYLNGWIDGWDVGWVIHMGIWNMGY